jgi:predicted O-methyltransferase YrrM
MRCLIIIKDWTTKAAEQIEDNSLDFVFIDADHSKEAVRNDINIWSTKVKGTGWILGHDINWPEVKAIVDELLPGYVIGPDNVWGRAKILET